MAISQIYDMSARQVWVGRYDEHGSREVAWDVSPWTSKLGSDGVFALLVTRPRDTDSPYNAQVSFDASTNLVTWAVTDVDTALKGWGRAELHYYVDGALVKSQTFVTIIEKAMFAGSTAPSAAEGWVERMEQAALDARAAAETAEDAETTATSAATTATSAAATAITAANSASSSASSARADATTATNAATAAALSESAASTSATNAAASAEAASTSALTASTAASTATTKASQASASASTAATAATTATNKASEATTAAQTATTKAGEASTSASTATSAKDTAVSASQTATTKATEATTAAATATSAATTATTAKDDAVSAKTAAQTAQTGAETAAASVQSSAAQIATNAADISQLKSDLNDKADKVGYSENLISGLSEQLDSKNVMVDQVPYVFRKTPTGAGTRKRETVVGGTVNWNQLIATVKKTFTNASADTRDYVSFRLAHGSDFVNVASVSAVGIVRVIVAPNFSGTSVLKHSGASQDLNFATNIEIISGHKYYVNVDFLAVDPTTVGGISTQNQMLFDLTAMFGTTIADYIYGLETAHAGDGVALFRSLFPNDYYSYSAGGLESVKVSGHKTVGKNLMSTPIVGEYVTDAGVVQEMNSAHWRTDKILVPYGVSSITMTKFTNPNGYEGSFGVIWFDSQGNVISYEPFFSGTHSIPFYQTKSVPANASYCYLRGYYGSGAAAVLSCKAQAEWGSVSTEYEPHEEHTYPLDPVDLRGIWKLDANNKIYCDGDVYEAEGSIDRNYNIVDLGTLVWTYDSTNQRFYASLNDAKLQIQARTLAAICSKYVVISNGIQIENVPDKSAYLGGMPGSTSAMAIYVHDSSYATTSAFTTAVENVYLVYPLATPTTEPAAPFVPVMAVDPDGTEEYIDAGVTASTPTRDVAIPAGHYSEYPENQVAKLDGLPKDFSTLIAPTEQTYTATRNYTSGALLIVNNILYKATANIANGGTITPNTNVTATTLAEVIAAL